MIHELKCLPEYFRAVRCREKPFEVRKNDRDYKVGDILVLREYIPAWRWVEQYEGDGYTGETESVRVTYVLEDTSSCKDDYVVLGLGYDDWISVKARLPEEIGLYLVYEPDLSIPNRSVAYFNGYEFNLLGRITHWMPLPEPPKGVCDE